MASQEALLKDLVGRICAAFPDVAEQLRRPHPNDILADEDDVRSLERFSALASAAVCKSSFGPGKAYFKFMEAEYSRACAAKKQIIHTYFVRPLFFQISERSVKAGWPEVPELFKQLYIHEWGHPPR